MDQVELLLPSSRNKEKPGSPIPEFCGLRLRSGWLWLGPGVLLSRNGISDHAVDAYCKYASSIIAIIEMGENTSAGLLPLATEDIYSNLGFQWASTTLAFVALAFSVVPFFYLFGGREIRAKSPFMWESMQVVRKKDVVGV
ncbi:hypothetical protein N7532_011331 [Penicillium argentinense]|uniref:Uncharacterized protein n=1 Tax=Penicillium argentinense TaxID=1131581 RepID=A0A9W9JUQ3_9EURO|nr:uncharacterized protein N7532_011331 [Penicillium argentinense]KAJ5082288.1 hypothetical protein N7532_011331 [Penicillium argentinense]